MSAKYPVLLPVGVASPADQVRVVEIDGLAEQGGQVIAIVERMARHAPDSATPVVDLAIMRRLQCADLRIRFHRFVTLRTGIEEKILLARHDLESRRIGKPLEA
jgi:hypothetical protein